MKFDHLPIEQFRVESVSGDKVYTVSHYKDGWQHEGGEFIPWRCSCIGWTRHMPRRDCKHILWVEAYGPQPVDPLLMAVMKAQKGKVAA